MTRHDAGPGSDFHDAVEHLHGSYRAQHVSHGPPDVLVDDVVTSRMVVPHLLRAAFLFLAPQLVLGLFWLLAMLVSLTELTDGGRAGVGTGLAGFIAILQLALLAFGFAALFFPIKEPIAEYSQLVEGRGWAGTAAYYWIARAADEHRIDFGHRANTVGGRPVMLFREGRLQAMIVVRSYGDHLYLGWTMWRGRSTVVLVGHFVRDLFTRLSLLGEARAELRATDARGMREVVHSLVREGAQAAIMIREMADEVEQTPDSIRAYVASLTEMDPGSVDPFRS